VQRGSEGGEEKEEWVSESRRLWGRQASRVEAGKEVWAQKDNSKKICYRGGWGYRGNQNDVVGKGVGLKSSTAIEDSGNETVVGGHLLGSLVTCHSTWGTWERKTTCDRSPCDKRPLPVLHGTSLRPSEGLGGGQILVKRIPARHSVKGLTRK